MSKTDELILRKEIVRTIAVLFEKDLITLTGGNVGARLHSPDHFRMTPRGLFKLKRPATPS